MAIQIAASKYKRNTNNLLALACVLIIAWLLYDGWFNEKFQREQTDPDGRPNTTLQSNRLWLPIFGAAAAIYFLLSAYYLKSQKITADHDAIRWEKGLNIPYDKIKQIDKRYFEKEGHFTIFYLDPAGADKKVKLSDRDWDGLGIFLDEIIQITGLVPQSALKSPPPSTPASS